MDERPAVPRPTALLSDTVEYTLELLPLAVVPLVTALLQWNQVTAAAAASDRYGVTFGFPLPVVDLWSFVNAPTEGPAGGVSPGAMPVSPGWSLLAVLAGALAFAVVAGLLLAGYLGSIDEGIAGTDGAFDFPANVRRYATAMIGFELLVFGTVLATVGLVAVLPGLFPVSFLALVVLGYLFYPAPYLVVVAEEPLADALGRGLALTTGERAGETLAFFGAYVVLSAALSVPFTAVTLNSGLAGVVLAAAAAAPVGLALAVLTYLFVASLVPEAPDDRRPASRR